MKKRWLLSAAISLVITVAIYVWSLFYNWGIPFFTKNFTFSQMVLPFIMFFVFAVLVIHVIVAAIANRIAYNKMTDEEKQEYNTTLAKTKEERQEAVRREKARRMESIQTKVRENNLSFNAYQPATPNFRSGFSDAYLPSTKKEAELMAAQWIKQASDSVKSINTTKKPNVFFERYNFYFDTLERLVYCERWVRFNGTPPSVSLLSAENERNEQVRLFILRYAQDTREKMYQLTTQRGKLNKAETYYHTLTEYSDRIDDQNIVLLSEQYELLKQLAQ